MLPAFRLLAKLKFLRGTAFDTSGCTEERRTERALIGEYEALIGQLIGRLTASKMPLALELANLSDEIRGYGHMKENNLRAVRIKWKTLTGRWNGSGDTAQHVT